MTTKRRRSPKQKLAAARAVLEGVPVDVALGVDDSSRSVRQPGESYVEEPAFPERDEEHAARFPSWWRALRGL